MTGSPLSVGDVHASAERSSLDAVLASLQVPWLAVLLGCARDDAGRGRALVNLTEPEGRALGAVAALLLPPERAAAGAALAAHFVDRAFDMRFFADALPVVRGGLADLDARAWPLGARDGFASLAPAQQAAVLRDVRESAFYATLVDLLRLADASAESHPADLRPLERELRAPTRPSGPRRDPTQDVAGPAAA